MRYIREIIAAGCLLLVLMGVNTHHAHAAAKVEAEFHQAKQTIVISGQSETDEAHVPILVFDDTGQLVYINQVQSDVNGAFQLAFPVEDKLEARAFIVKTGSEAASPPIETAVSVTRRPHSVVLPEQPVIRQGEMELLDSIAAQIQAITKQGKAGNQRMTESDVAALLQSTRALTELLTFIAPQAEWQHALESWFEHAGYILKQPEFESDYVLPAAVWRAALQTLAEVYVAKVGTFEVSAARSGTQQSVSFPFASIQQLERIADESKAAAARWQEILNDTGINGTLGSEIVIHAAHSRSLSSVQFELPAELLHGLAQRQISTLKLKTDFATLSLTVHDLYRGEDTDLMLTLTRIDDALQADPAHIQLQAHAISQNGDVQPVAKFGQSVAVIVPFTLKQDNHMVTAEMEKDGQMVHIGGIYLAQHAAFRFLVSEPGVYYLSAAPLSHSHFNDLNTTPWAEKYVRALALQGVFPDWESGQFNPNAGIDFETLIKWTSRLISTFDQPSAQTFVEAVSELQYDASASVIRQDLAVIVAAAFKALHLPQTADDSGMSIRFTDWGESERGKQAALINAVHYGVLSGRGSQIMAPLEITTRAEAATALYQLRALREHLR